jgi:hypothetical protein
MGNQNAAMCLNCFIKYSNVPPEEVASISIADPLVSNMMEGCLIEMKSIPTVTQENQVTLESTDLPIPSRTEQLLTQSDQLFQQFLDLINSSENDTSFVQVVAKEGITVYSKDVEEGFVLKCIWKIPYSPDEFINFIGNIEHRKKWDKNIDQVKVVDSLDEKTRVMHLLYKRILTVSPRELLVLNRKQKRGEVWFDVSASIQSSEFPENPSYIRAHLYIGGHMIEPCLEEDGTRAKITNYVQADFGGSLPATMIKKMSAMTLPQFAKSITKAIEKLRS